MRACKRILGVFLGTVLLLWLCGCGASVKGNTTYSGTVTALSLTSVTLETEDGEVTIFLTEGTTFAADPAQTGRDDMGGMELPDGEMGQLPEGNMELPDGQMGGGMMGPDGRDDMMPDGDKGNFDSAAKGFSVYDLSLGDSVTVETDKDGNAATVTVAIGDAMFGVFGR